MQTLNNVHQQFAEFFESESLKPFAYLLSKRLSEGHICLRLNELPEDGDPTTPYDLDEASRNAENLSDEPLVATTPGEMQPFVLYNGNLYLQRYFSYETEILQRIQEFTAAEQSSVSDRIAAVMKHAALVNELFPGEQEIQAISASEHINWQLVAAVTAVLNNFTIITGGPGTGKTTTVAKILALLTAMDPRLRVALAAPTGKAAARMGESLKAAATNAAAPLKNDGLTPVTIHRLLKPIANSPYFKHNRQNPLLYDVVIVDESSMIDAALFAKLLTAIGPQTRLILLGDKDQLASVEAGSLFGDLCKTQAFFAISKERASLINSLITRSSQKIPPSLIVSKGDHQLFEHIVELKKSHRFSSEKGIGRFSKAIIRNDVDVIREYLHTEDKEVIIDQDYNESVFQLFVDGYQDYIREPDIKAALRKFNSLRVLCAVKEGEQGVHALNTAIESHLRKKKLLQTTARFYLNRPVIITKNYYSLGLFNGDVGIIRPDENGVMKAWFEDSDNELKSALPGYISEAETVFAMTIHKSQGSEYDSVLTVLPDTTEIPILTRELLYTAVTRAKSKLILQGREAVILHTAAGQVKRASGLKERFGETNQANNQH